MKKLLIKTLNAGFLQDPLLAFRSDLPRIVYYHLVSDSPETPYYYQKSCFSPKALGEQLRWYKNKGYKFISLNEAVYLAENREKATKTIAFTTDDGFKENYTVMAPVLADFQATATLFLVSDCLNNQNLIWNNKLYLIRKHISAKQEAAICFELAFIFHLNSNQTDLLALSKCWPMAQKDQMADYAWELAGLPPLKTYLQQTQPYLSHAQVKELLQAGYLLGSHSKTHPDFSKLSSAEARTEMLESKNQITETYQTEVDYYAYPFGKRPSDKTVETDLLQNNTYKLLFGTKSNLNNHRENLVWERDKMEQEINQARFWFAAVPALRYVFLHPMGIYK